MIKDKISIIISLYNKAPYIAETIECVLKQTYNNFELIIVDDGSTDGGGEICDQYVTDERVRVYHTPNGGMSAARKYGLDQASGNWISFLDADDILDRNFLKVLSDIDTDADIITTGITTLKDGWEEQNTDADVIEFTNTEALLHVYCPISENDSFLHLLPGKIIKKSLYDRYFEECKEEIDKIPLNFFDDVFLIPNILYLASKVCVHTSLLYKYRIVEDSSCHSLNYRPFHYEQVDAAEMVVKMYEREGLKDVYFAALPDFLLVAHKAWYAARISKEQNEKLDAIQRNIERITEQYYEDCINHSPMKLSKKISIILFKKCRRLWIKVMDLYFGRCYSYMKRA